jgi:hypothetical protein
MARSFATPIILLTAAGCAASSPAIEPTAEGPEPHSLDGVYEYEATVTVHHETESGNRPETRRIIGTFVFAEGRLVDFTNDYSTPCHAGEARSDITTRSINRNITQVACPNLTVSVDLARGAPLQPHDVALRARLIETQVRTSCTARNSDGDCIEWNTFHDDEWRWRPLKIVSLQLARR